MQSPDKSDKSISPLDNDITEEHTELISRLAGLQQANWNLEEKVSLTNISIDITAYGTHIMACQTSTGQLEPGRKGRSKVMVPTKKVLLNIYILIQFIVPCTNQSGT